jgi:deoxyribonuclease V
MIGYIEETLVLEISNIHDWPGNPNDAVRIQQMLKPKIIAESLYEKLEYITAVDTAYYDRNNRLYAAAVTVKYPELTDVERAVAEMDAVFPYIPALLSFRDGPVILKALSRLNVKPDIVIFPGHGIAHPRGLGMASHLGLLTDISSIGCARRPLCGDFRNPSSTKGSCSSIFVANIEVGFVYRTKENVKPMFISPGHKCSLRDSVDIVAGCLTEYRMPEPLRLAHLFANKYKQSVIRKMGLVSKSAVGTEEFVVED